MGRGRPALANYTDDAPPSRRSAPLAETTQWIVKGPEGDRVEISYLAWLCCRALETSTVELASVEDARTYLGKLAEGFPLRARELAVSAWGAGYRTT